MKKIIVTAGEMFTDIDAIACAIAYGELLKLEGKDAEVVLPGPLNHSVTSEIRTWDFTFGITPSASDFQSVLVDVSNQDSFAKFATLETIVEIYDHHFGFQDFWQEKLGADSHIELIGACATQIWEEFKKRGFADKISVTSANLLYTAILSNTLNFGAQVTDKRDVVASEELRAYTDLPEDWLQVYFNDQEKEVCENVKDSIVGDTKVMNIPTLPFPIVIGQMELWDSKKFLDDHISQLNEIMETFGYPHWIVTLPSIKEGKNYLYTNNVEMKDIFSKIIDARFIGDLGETSKLWLRKEIRKKIYEITP